MPLSELTTARNRLHPSLVSRLITTHPAGVESCGGSPLWILAMVRRVVVQLAAGVESLRGHPVPACPSSLPFLHFAVARNSFCFSYSVPCHG